MKSKHAASYALEARALLGLLKIRVGQQYHSLRTVQIESLRLQADAAKYQAPKDSNRPREHSFFDLLQRRAQEK
jgi:hypothetical protein